MKTKKGTLKRKFKIENSNHHAIMASSILILTLTMYKAIIVGILYFTYCTRHWLTISHLKKIASFYCVQLELWAALSYRNVITLS